MPTRERGSVMVVAMLALAALLSLGGLTILNVQGGMAASGHERFRTIAVYAAESGVAAGMTFLRANVGVDGKWSAFVSANNTNPPSPTGLTGNGIQPAATGNVFSDTLLAWYEVEIHNNQSDPEFALGNDSDARVILRATGHGPNGATAIIEVEVRSMGGAASTRPCPAYAQKGMAEDGSGRNDCLGTIDATNVATFAPGG